ncbi:MAG TPA: F0F1 ATP synthase subunit B [Phycisphaerales bacterium]|nr:F0F1 ATP synthase subunit B [Phycisphaerales bacterium]HMP37960.1 F0F1 ATP synthase subunit B [Phycisphaerales bacterium]
MSMLPVSPVLLAAEMGEPMDFQWVPHVLTIVVFLATFVFLYKVAWPRIVGGLEAREQKILNDLRSADEAREQAKAALASYERSLAEARTESAKLIAQAKADAEAVAAQLRSRNETELAAMKQRAMQDIDAARAAAVTDLHAQSANLATAMARQILRREIGPSDQQRLIEESLKELAASRRN